MRLTDMHVHTDASEDSDAPVRSMCDAAVAQGLEVIAITDHAEIVGYREHGYDRTVAQSWKESGEVAAEYEGQLRIARGIELGEPLYNMDITQDILGSHAFDFVLGSMHKLGDETDYYFYDYTGLDIGREMERYFEAVLDMVRWGGFHSLAHLTYPFRYMPEDRRPADYRRWQGQLDDILRLLAQKGMALEINTSGLRCASIGRPSPELPVVKRFRELGGELVTVGSDAHRPQDVASHIPYALEMAREAGFRHTAVYFGGRPEMVPIG